MADKKDILHPKKNNPDEEKEDMISEEYEEKSKFRKITENKRIKLAVIGVLVLAGMVYLFSPSKEKEEPKTQKKNVQTSDSINIEQLESKPTDEEALNNNLQSTTNQQEFFAYEDGNLQTQNTPELNMSNNNSSGYTYGNYPSYYDMDEIPNDHSSGSGQKQQSGKTAERGQSTSISFERGNKQKSSEPQGAEQTGTQQQIQAQSVQKKSFQLSSGLTAPASPYEIKTGELIPAVLTTSVDSDLSGNVTAIVSQDVYDSIRGKFLLIPKGSKLFGTYDSNIIYGQNRLMLIWQRIILPNGYSINLETMQGIDVTGQAGVKGKVNNHTLKLLRSIVLSSLFNFVSSGVGVTYNNNTGSSDNVSVSATIGKDVTDDTAAKIQNAGDMIIARDLNQQPTIKIKAGTKFSVMVNNDMVLLPYDRLKGK